MSRHKLYKYTFLTIACIGALSACQTTNMTKNNETLLQPKMFQEDLKNFPREEKNLREWDTPVVADLDQDGYPDLLLNDHGFAIRVLWNNKGKYSKPYDLIMGDMHGVSVADFDLDGNLELIISRGGGSGSNARNSIMYRVDKNRNFTVVPDFKEPLAFMRGRTVKFIDGDNDGDLDLLNFAFPSSDKKGTSENYLYKNTEQNELVLSGSLPESKSDGQKSLVTDFNGDNILDILLYGFKHVKAYQGKGDFTYEEVTNSVFNEKLYGVTGIAEIDYDNDGDFDLVLSRGHEFSAGETFYNKEEKIWGFHTKRGEFRFDNLELGDVLNIENIQSQWPHKDIYLGESAYNYVFPGETHSGRDIRLVNSDTLGFPDTLDKKGTYIGYVGNKQWTIGINIWSPSTGIIHGVESYPEYNHKPGLTDLLIENRNGKFVDVSNTAKLTLTEHTTSVAIADIDNNGYQDIIMRTRGNLISPIQSLVYLNNGNKTFKLTKEDGITTPELGAIGMGIEPVDYNQDGQIDFVVGNDRGKWHLFKNSFAQSTGNNYLTVQVGKDVTNKVSALGALVKVAACNNQQIKRVGSTGANYSLSFDTEIHFGLGQCEEPVTVTVTWSNNQSVTQVINTANQTVVIGKL